MENKALVEPDYNRTLEKCADFYLAWTGNDCDQATAELLTMYALDYYTANREGNRAAANLALESTLSYVNTEMSSDEYEEYVDTFEDYLSDCD